jgi:hypothetical protein
MTAGCDEAAISLEYLMRIQQLAGSPVWNIFLNEYMRRTRSPAIRGAYDRAPLKNVRCSEFPMEVSALTAVTKTPIFTTALLTSVVTPYLLYAFTYFFPDAFHRVMRQNTLVAVTSIAKAIKIPLYLIEALSAGINWSGCVIGLPMVIVGQYLNYLVHRRLGKVRA